MAAKNAHAGRHAKGSMPSYGSRTDVGLVRDHNEDSLAVVPPIFAVADGMGGHAAGEVASEVAIQTLLEHAPAKPDGDGLARAVVEANRAVMRAARDGIGRKGMGTTMTAAMLSGQRLVVAQVGDSRAYLLHAGSLQRITRDHSLMTELIESGEITEEQAKYHPKRSVITRALGSDPDTLPDIYEMNLSEGDRLLLCSDGLSGMVEDALLESTLARIKDPQNCANALVEEAIAAGGYDNVTAVVVDVASAEERKTARARLKGRIGALALILALVAVVVGGAFGANAYLNTVAFLTVENSQVAVHRGLPGQFMGVSLSKPDHVTGLSVDSLDLPANTQQRLETEGIRCDTVEAADELAQTWKDQAEAKAKSNGPLAGTLEGNGEGAASEANAATNGEGDANKTNAAATASTANTNATAPSGDAA